MERSICAAALLRPGSSASASPSACRRDRLHPRMHADRRRRLTVRRCSAEDGVAVRELQGEELQRWQASRGALEALDLSEEEAERVMKRAFGWTTQAWWRDSKVCEVPAQGQVEAVLDFLAGVGVKGPDATKVLKKFPEVIACSVEERLQENVRKLERDWKIKGPAATNVIKRQPQVLGYAIDCQGNCEGQCNRCWVRL